MAELQSDSERVGRFFRLTRGKTDPERVRLLGGEDVVSVSTIRRWRGEIKKDGKVRPLTGPVAAALDDYLQGRELTQGDTDAARTIIRDLRDRLDELEAQLPPLTPEQLENARLFADTSETLAADPGDLAHKRRAERA